MTGDNLVDSHQACRENIQRLQNELNFWKGSYAKAYMSLQYYLSKDVDNWRVTGCIKSKRDYILFFHTSFAIKNKNGQIMYQPESFTLPMEVFRQLINYYDKGQSDVKVNFLSESELCFVLGKSVYTVPQSFIKQARNSKWFMESIDALGVPIGIDNCEINEQSKVLQPETGTESSSFSRRSKYDRINLQTKEKARELFRNGFSIRKVAGELNIGVGSAYDIHAQMNGLKND